MLPRSGSAVATIFIAACMLTTGSSHAQSSDASTTPSPTCVASTETNRQLVLDFYRLALIERHPRAAFQRYMAANFIEHKPDVETGTREAAATFLEQLITNLPDPRWQIVRTIAEGDMVFLHASFSPAPGAGVYAIADIFRLRDCMIVEHWDVVAGPPDSAPNPHSRF